MKYLAVLLVCAVGFAAAATYGDYIPKAYFVIDNNGNPSAAHPINTETLNRARRQVQPFQPFGQPGFGFPAFPQIQPGQGSGSFVSSSQTLNSRFGEEDQVSGQSTFISSNGNKVTQTNTILRPDGTTHTTQTRHKRQQSQTQSQNGQGGSQLQSQTQDAPGGQQHQTQSQGQHLEPVATPAVNIPVSDNRHDNVVPVQSGGQQLAPQGGEQQFAPQGGQQQHAPQGGEQQYAPQPQGGQQQYAPQPQGGQQQYAPQGNEQQYVPQGNEQQYAPQTENRNQPSYPQPQGNYQPGFAPFGFGAFGPGGFPQQGFGFPQQGFGFPQQGFGGVGFGAPGFGFQQPGFGGPAFGAGVQPGPGSTFTGNRLDSRFSDDDDAGLVGTSGGTTSFISSNNGVFHSTSSILGPDGKVITKHTTGKL